VGVRRVRALTGRPDALPQMSSFSFR
jgi:hypothetical protein